MPFANLLTLSYSGTLGPLRSVPEEKEKKIEEEPEVPEEEIKTEKEDEKQVEKQEETASAELEHSQRTVVDDCMNETMKPPR